MKRRLKNNFRARKLSVCETLPIVSIVVPVYNVREYISVCLSSLLGQTLRNIEIICVDDGSTDGSLDELKKFESMDSRIMVVRTDHSGAGAARNAGLAVARGKYVDFVDPDDFVVPEMMERLYERAEMCKAQVVVSGLQRYDYTGKVRTGETAIAWRVKDLPVVFSGCDVADRIFSAFLPSPCNKFFCREYINRIGDTFQNLPRCNDVRFTFIALSLAQRITVVDASYYCYRVGRPGSCQNTSDIDPKCVCEAYRAVRQFLQEHNVFGVYKKSYTRAAFSSCFYTLGLLKDTRTASEFYDYLHSDACGPLLDCNVLRLYDYGNEFKEYQRIEAFRYGLPFALFVRLLHPTGAKVSVIMPVYNTERYLSEAIDSILKQSLHDIELLCVNDGSNEATCKILEDFARLDHRVFIINQINSGQGISRNKAISVATGKYVYFMDSDDMLQQDALESLYNRMEQDNLDQVIFSAKSFCDEATEELSEQISKFDAYYDLPEKVCNRISDGKMLLQVLQKEAHVFVSPPLRLIRLDVVLRNDCRFAERCIHEDESFTYHAVYASRRAVAISEKYYCRRVRPGSTMTGRSPEKQIEGLLFALVNLVRSGIMQDSSCAAQDVATNIMRNFRAAIKKCSKKDEHALKKALVLMRKHARDPYMVSMAEYLLVQDPSKSPSVLPQTKSIRCKKLLAPLNRCRLAFRYGNVSLEGNNVIVETENESIRIEVPKWLAESKRGGCYVTTSLNVFDLSLHCKGDGRLVVEMSAPPVYYKGRKELRDYRVRYKSFEVNGENRLAGAVTASFKDVAKIELDVKDGDRLGVRVCFEPLRIKASDFADFLKTTQLAVDVNESNVLDVVTSKDCAQFIDGPLMKSAVLANRTNQWLCEPQMKRNDAALEIQRNNLAREVEALKHSESYRVGLFVTWPARWVYCMLKCYHENGLKCTLRRLILGMGRGVDRLVVSEARARRQEP